MGAGRPFRGNLPAGLNPTPDHRRVLDWIKDGFAGVATEIHFVGGYLFEEVAKSHPDLVYTFNPDWESTGSIGSLFAAPLSDEEVHYVCYNDIVFGKAVVARLAKAAGDVVLAVDRNWRNRFEGRSRRDLEKAEKVILTNGKVTAAGAALEVSRADAEFVGLLKLSPRAMTKVASLRKDAGPALRDQPMPVLIEEFIRLGLPVRVVDVEGDWAELNAPQDLARFVLGTKAQTLERLQSVLRLGRIGKMVTFSTGEWRANPDPILKRIRRELGPGLLILRSSALSEDSWHSANAGVFETVPNVRGDDAEGLRENVERVIASYGDELADHRVLVQGMLEKVRASGVVFTRTLKHGAPYYTVNFDDVSGKTDTVTSGSGTALKLMVVHRLANEVSQSEVPWIANLLEAVREIESLVGHDSLDIEFAITRDEAVQILQLRPIAVDHSAWRVPDETVEGLLRTAEAAFRQGREPTPFVLGRRNFYGVMTDWNPAEMIGIKPSRLSLSLYRFLITDEVWATQRAEYGYRDVRPRPLLVAFAGHPYVDIRADFNSFIPAALPEALAERLVEHYLDVLEADPSLHDKVEFEVVFTCLVFDFDRQARRLREAGFTDAEVAELKNALREITRKGFERYPEHLAKIELLEERFNRIAARELPPLERACLLLEDCRRYGTLAFAHLARGAFVAVALLRSAVREGILSEAALAAHLNSVNTVGNGFLRDVGAVSEGSLAWEELVSRYGHLRPGTYEITSPSYGDDPETYLRPLVEAAGRSPTTGNGAEWAREGWQNLGPRLAEVGLPEDTERFDAFARDVIAGREYGKFVFTRNLSVALDALAEFGEGFGISRNELAEISIEDFFSLRSGVGTAEPGRWLKLRAEEGAQWQSAVQAVELPPLIFREQDFRAFLYPPSQPNFVGDGSVTREVAALEAKTERPGRLDGKIVAIPQADPGFDWLFGCGIAGLITAYGGANSHMAIRAAELNLPAAIGVGEILFSQVVSAQVVELDCRQRWIRIIQ